jgi:hypothetical protein
VSSGAHDAVLKLGLRTQEPARLPTGLLDPVRAIGLLDAWIGVPSAAISTFSFLYAYFSAVLTVAAVPSATVVRLRTDSNQLVNFLHNTFIKGYACSVLQALMIRRRGRRRKKTLAARHKLARSRGTRKLSPILRMLLCHALWMA